MSTFAEMLELTNNSSDGIKKYIERNFDIVNKNSEIVPFVLNPIQIKYLLFDMSGRDIILKARQEGFSSLILARFTKDFLTKPNSRSVVVADIDENAIELLDKVKFYIRSYEEKNKVKVPLKYNTRSEIYNEANNARYSIGTAQNTEFGRSKTITNLHLSESAFYPNLEKILAGAGQAVVPNGYFVIETTANGFNEFKSFWDDSVLGLTGFKPLFYRASDFYSEEFLAKKKVELKRLYPQEYPDNPQEAFLTSGSQFFDSGALRIYLEEVQNVAPVPII